MLRILSRATTGSIAAAMVCQRTGSFASASAAGDSDQLLEKLGNVKVFDVAKEQDTTLKSLWAGDKPVVITFLRRWGCPLCRMWSEDLSTIAPDLKTAGVELHGVGTSRKGLDEFESMQFLKGGKLYVDDEGAAYAALNFKELGLLDGFGLLSPAAHKAYMEARHRRVPGNFEEAEKGMQLGGTLVIDPKGGKGGAPHIVFMHSQTGYADQPEPQDILKAVQGALNTHKGVGPTAGGNDEEHSESER